MHLMEVEQQPCQQEKTIKFNQLNLNADDANCILTNKLLND